MLLALGFALHLPAAQPCPLGTHGHRNMASSGMGPDTQRPEPCSHTEMSGLLSSSATLPDARRIAVCVGSCRTLPPGPTVEARSRGIEQRQAGLAPEDPKVGQVTGQVRSHTPCDLAWHTAQSGDRPLVRQVGFCDPAAGILRHTRRHQATLSRDGELFRARKQSCRVRARRGRCTGSGTNTWSTWCPQIPYAPLTSHSPLTFPLKPENPGANVE